jgi:hypothetical protein
LLIDTVVYRQLRVQVNDEHFYDGPDNSDYETDDSNGISLCLFSSLPATFRSLLIENSFTPVNYPS